MPVILDVTDGLQRKGWMPEEAIAYLRWCEHVNPTIDEAVALVNMRAVRLRVEERLARLSK